MDLRHGSGRAAVAVNRRGSILVVDDEEIMREILEALLTREGYTVRVAASGEEGLELARAVPFDAALVDDARVAHGVTPVRAIDPGQPAHRDVLVVTFKHDE